MLILENVLGRVAHLQSGGRVLEAFFFPISADWALRNTIAIAVMLTPSRRAEW